MLEAAIYLASGLGATLLALLLLPVVVALRVDRTDHPVAAIGFRLDGRLFAGLIGVSVRHSGEGRRLYPVWHRWTIGRGRVLGERADTAETAAAAQTPEEAVPAQTVTAAAVPEKKDRPHSGTLVADLVTMAQRIRQMFHLLARPGMQLLGSLHHVARLRSLSLTGNLGLGDPATTGSICALLLGIRAFNSNRVRVDIAPDFVTSRMDGHFHLVVHLYLGCAIACIARFGLRVGLGWLALRLRTLKRRYLVGRHFSF